MKELHDLLPFIKCFLYDPNSEKLALAYSSNADKAAELYNRAVLSVVNVREGSMYGNPVLFHNSDSESLSEDEDLLWRRTPDEQWQLDIAIDCVRRMSQEDIDHIRDHPWTGEYHFGYTMWIRNQYIHSAHKHHAWMADDESGDVMKKIFSILIPGYDYRRKACTKYFESFRYQEYYGQYGDTQKDIFDNVAAMVLSDEYEMAEDDAIEELRKRLVERLGKDEFIRIFKSHYLEAEGHKLWNSEEQDDFWDRVFRNAAVLFPLEYNQVRCLRSLYYFRDIKYMSLKSREECRRFIDTKLGLKEEYAEFMARCGWEACNPLTNGLWKDLQLRELDLDYDVEKALKDQGIETLGDVSEKTFSELAAIPEMGEENALKVKDSMTALGLCLPE